MRAIFIPLLLLASSACANQSASARAATHEQAEADSLFARPWHWDDENGAPVSFATWRGAPLVVSAIYTSCTSTCPLTIEKLRAVDAAFRRKNQRAEFVLVTLDPHTDTPERLRSFRESRQIPAGWHLLRGSDADTQALGRLLHVRAVYDSAHIIHDARIAVFDERGQLKRNFRGWAFRDDDAELE
jgi:protein SCO1/2